MDIAAPSIKKLVSPPPHLVRDQWVDKQALVRELVQKHPDATPDQIAAMCAQWGISVSAIFIARIIQTLRAEQRNTSPKPPSPAQPELVGAGRD